MAADARIEQAPESIHLAAMLQLFATAPWSAKVGLMGMQGRELALGLRLLRPVG